MAHYRRNAVWLAGWALFIALATGCAATHRNVTLRYEPVAAVSGGSGELWLAAVGSGSLEGKPDVGPWAVGKVKNSDGKPLGDVLTREAPAELILDAFSRELTNAGFGIRRVDALPQGVSKGILITVTEMKLEEVSGLMKVEGTSRLTVSLQLWKKGNKGKKLDYESSISDIAVKDRERLLPTIWRKAMQNLMKSSLPDIIRELNG